jgi:hypothetical protein
VTDQKITEWSKICLSQTSDGPARDHSVSWDLLQK